MNKFYLYNGYLVSKSDRINIAVNNRVKCSKCTVRVSNVPCYELMMSLNVTSCGGLIKSLNLEDTIVISVCKSLFMSSYYNKLNKENEGI